MLRRRYHTARD